MLHGLIDCCHLFFLYWVVEGKKGLGSTGKDSSFFLLACFVRLNVMNGDMATTPKLSRRSGGSRRVPFNALFPVRQGTRAIPSKSFQTDYFERRRVFRTGPTAIPIASLPSSESVSYGLVLFRWRPTYRRPLLCSAPSSSETLEIEESKLSSTTGVNRE